MKYKSFLISGLLLINLPGYAQLDSSKVWKKLARQFEMIANENAKKAIKAKLDGDRCRYLSIANEISVKSQELNNKKLAALLAVQAYNFNSKYNGYENNRNVYEGLSIALKRYDSLPVKLSDSQLASFLRSIQKTDSIRKGNDLIVADQNGDIIIARNGIAARRLSFHQVKVEYIKFSSTGKFMVTVDKHNTICIWNLSNLTSHPLVIKENASIEGVAFSSDERQILVLVQKHESPIHVWPLTMDTMAKKLCSCIKQNMTLEEWEQYIGKDDVATGIPYESTCTNFPRRK